MGSEIRKDVDFEDSPQEWLKRLTVKVEPGGVAESWENAYGGENNGATSVDDGSSERHGGSSLNGSSDRRSNSSDKRKSPKTSKIPKEERLLTPTSAPVYVPALAPSQLPFGSSQVVKTGEETFSAGQLQLLDLSGEGATGLWRMHTKSGVNYRKGPFTAEERLLIEEALEQYAKREGLESVEAAVRSLSGNIGRKNCGRFHSIARCLPERPFVSVYGYIRRRISGNAKRGPWTEEETKTLVQLVKRYPRSVRGRWVKIGAVLNRRPADACDKWRILEPRLRQAESSSVPALEDKKGDDSDDQASGEPDRSTAAGALAAEAPHFNDTQKQQLLQEVQRKTGEDLPSFGIPWKQIQEDSFPNCEHALLRRVFCSSVFPAELGKRMGVDPRPVILRHVLRCLRRLPEPLPPRLRGIEWLDILPFVPAGLQREVVRTAASSITRDKGSSLETAIPQLIRDNESSLESMRKKDASYLLRATLPIAVQEALETGVLAKASLKGWSDDTVKKKLRKKLRKEAAKELDRLKSRLNDVRAAPLNAPPRGRGQRTLPLADAGVGRTGDVSILDGNTDAAVSEFLATPFTDGLRVASETPDPSGTARTAPEDGEHLQLEDGDRPQPPVTDDSSASTGMTGAHRTSKDGAHLQLDGADTSQPPVTDDSLGTTETTGAQSGEHLQLEGGDRGQIPITDDSSGTTGMTGAHRAPEDGEHLQLEDDDRGPASVTDDPSGTAGMTGRSEQSTYVPSSGMEAGTAHGHIKSESTTVAPPVAPPIVANSSSNSRASASSMIRDTSRPVGCRRKKRRRNGAQADT